MTSTIGLIAEDKSDINVAIEIFDKIIPKKSYTTKNFVGRGCGKLRRKCSSWADNLRERGCQHIIVFHDLDENDIITLKQSIERSLSIDAHPCSLVVIPVKELEAWLLSDVDAIKRVFNLSKTPKRIGNCELIDRPKEYLRDLVWKAGKKRYLNTVHNVKIANRVLLSNYRRCRSYIPLESYLKNHICG